MTLPSSKIRATAISLCRWILSLLKQGPRFIWAILQRLFYRWGFRGGQWRFLLTIDEEKKTGGSPPRRSYLPSGEAPRGYHVFNDDKPSLDTLPAKEGSSIVPDLSYNILDDGETISLNNVSCSAFPFPGGSIRNASQSSLNLENSRKAHEEHLGETSRGPSRSPSVLSRTPSRSSIHTNSSQGSFPNHIPFSIEDPEGTISHTHLGADLAKRSRVGPAIRRPTPILETDNERPTSILSETILPSPSDASVRHTTQSPTSRWLSMAHISPAIPFATQRYSNRPTV